MSDKFFFCYDYESDDVMSSRCSAQCQRCKDNSTIERLERELAEAKSKAGIFEGGMTSARAVLDLERNHSSVVLDQNPTIAELEWLLGAPDGYLTTETDPLGKTRVTLGPRLAPSASGQEIEVADNARTSAIVAGSAKR